VRFVIAGETAPSETAFLTALQNRAAELAISDRVIFTGLRSDVPALLSGVDVAVMPSLNEALSNVLLESMAAGRPVVATRVGGTPEALIDGDSGLLVPPGDPGKLAASIATLLNDRVLAERLGRAARHRIADHFSVDRMVQATERLYLDLLERKGKGVLRRVPTAAA
jgi:glycosyltransferase involved in cell wall biosynthesis